MADKALFTACWTWADESCGAAGVADSGGVTPAAGAFTRNAFSSSDALLACSFPLQAAQSSATRATSARRVRFGFIGGNGELPAGETLSPVIAPNIPIRLWHHRGHTSSDRPALTFLRSSPGPDRSSPS